MRNYTVTYYPVSTGICAIHWGEVAGITAKAHGERTVELVLGRLLSFGIQVVAATGERAVRAALIKVKHKVPYPDAFGVELASESPAHVLVTADFDLKPTARAVKIEFVPTK